MENRNWMRLVAVGIFLAAVGLGYVIYAQRARNAGQRTQNETRPIVQISPTPPELTDLTPTPAVLGEGGFSKGGVQTLPKTGFPMPLFGIAAASAIISGFFLRKFPK